MSLGEQLTCAQLHRCMIVFICVMLQTHDSAVSAAQHHSTFYIDDDPACVGILHKNGNKTEPRRDFSIHLDSLVEAAGNTGYLAKVTRALDKKTK